MKARLALSAALALGACHRHAAADVTLDADRDARNATQAKIDADLDAADAAARTPMPIVRPPPVSAATPKQAEADQDANEADVPMADDDGNGA